MTVSMSSYSALRFVTGQILSKKPQAVVHEKLHFVIKPSTPSFCYEIDYHGVGLFLLGNCSLKIRSLYCSKSAKFFFSSAFGSLMTSGALHSMVTLSGHPFHSTPRPHPTNRQERI